MINIETLLNLKAEAEELEARLREVKLDKAQEHVSAAIAELDTLIQISHFNRR